MSRPKGPCLGCATREPGCHARCPKYLEFRTELDMYNAIERDQANADSRMIGYEASKRIRFKKRYKT